MLITAAAKFEDVIEAWENIAPMNREECVAYDEVDPQRMIRECFFESRNSCAVRDGSGELVALAGMMDGEEPLAPWMVCTEAVARYPRSLIRELKEIIHPFRNMDQAQTVMSDNKYGRLVFRILGFSEQAHDGNYVIVYKAKE